MQEKIGSLVKTSLVDFPENVSAVIFLRNCNLRCPYCYNSVLAKGLFEDDFVTFDELKNHLQKRRNVLSGLVISGGEALLSPQLSKIIETAKSLGYKIKLDTNGTLPEKLNDVLKSESVRPDYIAMDFKTSPEKYHLLTQNKSPADAKLLKEKLLSSIRLLKDFGVEKCEFRTVLVPTLVSSEDIKKMAVCLPENARWFLTQFKNQKCLDPSYDEIQPCTNEENEKLLQEARRYVPKAEFR